MIVADASLRCISPREARAILGCITIVRAVLRTDLVRRRHKLAPTTSAFLVRTIIQAIVTSTASLPSAPRVQSLDDFVRELLRTLESICSGHGLVEERL